MWVIIGEKTNEKRAKLRLRLVSGMGAVRINMACMSSGMSTRG